MRAILELDPDQRSLLQRIEEQALPGGFLEYRYSYAPLGHYLIADFEQVLMATSPEPPIGKRPYLWTCNEKFVEIMCENFEETWHSCTDNRGKVPIPSV